MAKTYVRVTKLNDVTGRSDYISNPEKQDYIYNHEKSNDFDWKEYQEFEKKNQKSASKNNEARELVVALPNEISDLPAEERSKIAHSLAKELVGENRDYEFALHFNQSRTNFHMHLIFSERERSETAEIKRYKRDMWYDKETNRMAKKNAPGAELRYKKGQAMKDKDGNYRYTNEPFTVKDKKFTTREWLHNTHKVTQEVLSEHGYKLDIYDPEIEIKQQKLYKGADSDYLEFARTWNKKAKEINKETKEELTEITSDRDSFQDKFENFDVDRFQKIRKNMPPKTISDRLTLKKLGKQFDEIVEERDVLIDKYDLPEEKEPKSVIRRLNDKIISIYDQFKTKKQDLVKQLVTIKGQFVTERPQIVSKELLSSDKGIEPSIKNNAPEAEITAEKKDDLLEQEPEVFWYDVDWSDSDTKYTISNLDIIAFGDEDAVALAFELSDEDLEYVKVRQIQPERKLTADELVELEFHQKRAKKVENNSLYQDFDRNDEYGR